VSCVSGLCSNRAEALVQLKETGAEYLLEAQLESINVETEYLNGKTYYKAKTQFAYQLYCIADGSTAYSNRDFHYGNSTQDRNAAISESFGLVDNDIKALPQKSRPSMKPTPGRALFPYTLAPVPMTAWPKGTSSKSSR